MLMTKLRFRLSTPRAQSEDHPGCTGRAADAGAASAAPRTCRYKVVVDLVFPCAVCIFLCSIYLCTGLVRQEPSQRWGSLFPLNAWESALPAACRPPQTGPPITTGQMLPLF